MTLQEQALEIIEKLNLLKILNKYGEAHLVGNVALNTTVKPDIDVQIYVAEKEWDEKTTQIISQFEAMGLTDYITRNLSQSGKKLISFAINKFDKRWTLDITLTQKENSSYLQDAYKFYLDYKDKLTEENTIIIRDIKSKYKEKGLLRNSISFYIYNAVLDENIRTTDEFERYLKKHKND